MSRRIASLARKSPLERTFRYSSNGHIDVRFDVTLVYTTAEQLDNEQQRQTSRVIGNKRWIDIEDVESSQKARDELYNIVIADSIRKIDGLTLHKLNDLIGVESLGEDGPIPLDPSDKTPLDEATLADFKNDEKMREVKTEGDLAMRNIIDLLARAPRFRQWVATLITDVSWFTDKTLAEQRKN